MTQIVHKIILTQDADGWAWQETTENVRHTGFESEYYARLYAIDTLEWDDDMIKIEWVQEAPRS